MMLADTAARQGPICINDLILAGMLDAANDMKARDPLPPLVGLVSAPSPQSPNELYDGVRVEFSPYPSQPPVIVEMWVLNLKEDGVRETIPKLSLKVKGLKVKESGADLTKDFADRLNGLVLDAGLEMLVVHTSAERRYFPADCVRVRAGWSHATDRTLDCAMALVSIFLEFVSAA